MNERANFVMESEGGRDFRIEKSLSSLDSDLT